MNCGFPFCEGSVKAQWPSVLASATGPFNLTFDYSQILSTFEEILFSHDLRGVFNSLRGVRNPKGSMTFQ